MNLSYLNVICDDITEGNILDTRYRANQHFCVDLRDLMDLDLRDPWVTQIQQMSFKGLKTLESSQDRFQAFCLKSGK